MGRNDEPDLIHLGVFDYVIGDYKVTYMDRVEAAEIQANVHGCKTN